LISNFIQQSATRNRKLKDDRCNDSRHLALADSTLAWKERVNDQLIVTTPVIITMVVAVVITVVITMVVAVVITVVITMVVAITVVMVMIMVMIVVALDRRYLTFRLPAGITPTVSKFIRISTHSLDVPVKARKFFRSRRGYLTRCRIKGKPGGNFSAD
jgi:ABC-type multidrug transport system fused ATPase/permease subunit